MNKTLIPEFRVNTNHTNDDFDDQFTNCGVIKLEVVKLHVEYSHSFDIVAFFYRLMDFYFRKSDFSLLVDQDRAFQIESIVCNATGYEIWLSFNSLRTSRKFKCFFNEFFFEFNVGTYFSNPL